MTIVCGDMVKRSKPEPDIYLEACARLCVKPENCYGIEDSYNGIRAVKTAGMHPIMVPDLAKPTEEMERLSECILSTLHEVKKYLENKQIYKSLKVFGNWSLLWRTKIISEYFLLKM